MGAKVGIIGMGIYGTHLLNSFMALRYDGLVDLISIADIDEEKMRKNTQKYNVRGYLDYRDMLEKENVDAIAVATPDFLHRSITMNVLNSKKHVLVQKPMDVTIEGCKEMLESSIKNDVLLEVDFHKRFDPAHRKLREAVQSGSLGNIQYGYAWIEDTIEVPFKWLKLWAEKSSPSWFIGIHYYDLFIWILNSKPRRVFASGYKDKLLNLGIDTFDSIQAKVEFENGSNIVFDSSWILPESFPSINNQGCRLIGTEGIWEIDAQDRGVWMCDQQGTKTNNYYFFREEKDALGRAVHHGYGVESIREFLMHVINYRNMSDINKSEATLLNSARDAIESTRIAVAIDKSISTKEIVELQN